MPSVARADLVMSSMLLAVVAIFLALPGIEWFFFSWLGLWRKLNLHGTEQCVRFPQFTSCEDGWLDPESGLLYLACADWDKRQSWLPPTSKLDPEGHVQDGHMVVVQSRAPYTLTSDSATDGVPYATFADEHIFRLPDAKDVGLDADGWGDGELTPHGVDFYPLDNGTIRIGVVNHRPSYDFATSGKKVGEGAALLDNTQVGANSTIEVFDTLVGSHDWKHVRTVADPLIRTPNSLAWVDGRSFIFSNDNKYKVGTVYRLLNVVRSRGEWTYCSVGIGCQVVGTESYPNGIARVGTNRFVLANSGATGAKLVELNANRTNLITLQHMDYKYPCDNVHFDPVTGSVFSPGFPRAYEMLKEITSGAANGSTTHVRPTSGASTVVLRMKADGKGGFVTPVDKVLEDDGSKVFTTTSSLFDAKTNRMWLTSFSTDFITVCQL